MRVYVASSWRNPRQPEVVKALREVGHDVYDFRNPAPGNAGFGWRQILPDPPPWSAEATRQVLAHPVAEEGFRLDFEAMRSAEAIVMVQPCGRSAALELGWGCGAGKRTAVLMADSQEPELMLKCADRLCLSIGEVLAFLRPVMVTRDVAGVAFVDGDETGAKGMLVTLTCGHKVATRERRTSYACARCTGGV